MKSLEEFKKQKKFLICFDSDGCIMDTMDIKHIECFGPCLVSEWNLQKWEKEILSRWNDINLYTITRGINRFKGLGIILKEINEKYIKINDIEMFNNWVNNSKELSNSALNQYINQNENCEIFKKALSWRIAVNKKINALPQENKIPFKMAKQALEFAHKYADVAIVSSANLDAVLEEWEKHKLLNHVDIVLAQNNGSKAHCIGELIKKGYDVNNVLMCGDAPGDRDAAIKNNVFYYPILVKKEDLSWVEFIDFGCNKFINDTYKGEYQEQKIKDFLKNLGE